MDKNNKTLYLRLDEEFVKDVTSIAQFFSKQDELEAKTLGLGLLNGMCYRIEFDNGYGASVIKHGGSYGYHDDLWEVAVLYHGHLDYTTPVTADVEGYCNDAEVNRILKFLKNYNGDSEQEFEFRDELLNGEGPN